MKIQSLTQQIGRTGASDPRTENTAPDRQPRKVLDSVHGDSVELSINQDLAKVVETSTPLQAAVGTLSPERLAEIRSRIQSGFYSTAGGLNSTTDSLLNFHSLPV
jgi:hypothetical protein